MSVIKKPAAEWPGSIVERTGEGTVAFSGDGPLTFVCGGCRSPLIEGANPGQFSNFVLRCNPEGGGCGAYNETLD